MPRRSRETNLWVRRAVERGELSIVGEAVDQATRHFPDLEASIGPVRQIVGFDGREAGLAVRHGAKGLQYFTYWTPDTPPGARIHKVRAGLDLQGWTAYPAVRLREEVQRLAGAASWRAEKKEPPESSSRGSLRCLLLALLAQACKVFRPHVP